MTKSRTAHREALATSSPASSLVITDVKITQHDLVMVAVSRAEQKINESLAQAQKRLRESEARTTDLQNSLNESFQATAKQFLSEVEAAFKPLATYLNGKPKPKISSLRPVRTSETKDELIVDIYFQEDESKSSYSSSSGFPCTKRFTLTKTERALLNDIDKEKEQTKAYAEAIVKARRQIAQLPSLERAYRARFVENELSKTKDGSDLLDSIIKNLNVQTDLLALPN